MRRISEMYKRSGGTCYRHTCSECVVFNQDKHCRCRNYELDVNWNPKWTACKFFADEENEDLKGQMNIFDFVK